MQTSISNTVTTVQGRHHSVNTAATSTRVDFDAFLLVSPSAVNMGLTKLVVSSRWIQLSGRLSMRVDLEAGGARRWPERDKGRGWPQEAAQESIGASKG